MMLLVGEEGTDEQSAQNSHNAGNREGTSCHPMIFGKAIETLAIDQ